VGLRETIGETRMKRILIGITLVLLVVTIISCSVPKELSLHQPVEEINQVELINNSAGDLKVLRSLSEYEIPYFIDSILELKCHKSFQPSGEYGAYVVRIVYKNGDTEYLGSSALAYESDESEYDGWYSLSHDDLYVLFAKYVNRALLPPP